MTVSSVTALSHFKPLRKFSGCVKIMAQPHTHQAHALTMEENIPTREMDYGGEHTLQSTLTKNN